MFYKKRGSDEDSPTGEIWTFLVFNWFSSLRVPRMGSSLMEILLHDSFSRKDKDFSELFSSLLGAGPTEEESVRGTLGGRIDGLETVPGGRCVRITSVRTFGSVTHNVRMRPFVHRVS